MRTISKSRVTSCVAILDNTVFYASTDAHLTQAGLRAEGDGGYLSQGQRRIPRQHVLQSRRPFVAIGLAAFGVNQLVYGSFARWGGESTQPGFRRTFCGWMSQDSLLTCQKTRNKTR